MESTSVEGMDRCKAQKASGGCKPFCLPVVGSHFDCLKEEKAELRKKRRKRRRDNGKKKQQADLLLVYT